MRQLYDDFIATWKDEAMMYNDYPKCAILFNRHIALKNKKQKTTYENYEKVSFSYLLRVEFILLYSSKRMFSRLCFESSIF